MASPPQYSLEGLPMPHQIEESGVDIVMQDSIIDLTNDLDTGSQIATSTPELWMSAPLKEPKSEPADDSMIVNLVPNNKELLLASTKGAQESTSTSTTDQVEAASGELRPKGLVQRLFLTPKDRAAEARLTNQRMQESMAKFQASLNINASPISGSPIIGSTNKVNVTGHVEAAADRSDDEVAVEEAEHRRAVASFAKLRNRFEKKERTFVEDIEFKKAQHVEEDRLRLRKKRMDLARESTQIVDAERMFFSDDDNPQARPSDYPLDDSPTADERDRPASHRFKPNRSNKIPAAALDESMRVGLDAHIVKESKSGKKRNRGKGASTKKSSKDKVTKLKGKKDKKGSAKQKGSGGRPKKGPQLTNINSILNSNVIANAQANRDKEGQATFTSKVKKNALQDLIASIPTEQRRTASADKTAMDKATRQFNRTMKADGNGGWILKGMSSSLHNHQLLGAAFMRERENSGHRPYGGIQSDDMGLGKTVMTIANILDGKPSDRSPNRTTLIICPPSLCDQWMDEIGKHTEPGAIGEVIIWRAGTRIKSTNPVKTLSSMDIVITTYGEILKSYPHCDAPSHLVSEEVKQRWWKDHYEKNRGVLHQIYFRRIVLDEAQTIKNHQSKTSVAVRGLNGKYRWAISGTPVQNSLSEFYPFFAFLKVEHTGSFETFKTNFCKKGSSAATTRLQAFLNKIMVRRTHQDQLFGRPIVKLPNITTNTVIVEFNPIEKVVYRIVKDRFMNKIQAFARADSLEKRYQTIFVLLLRLRQLTSHVLLIQKTLTELLEAEDLERLWTLTAVGGDANDNDDDASRNTLEGLKQALAKASETREKQTPEIGNGNEESGPPGPSTEETARARQATNSAGFAIKFRKFLKKMREDGHWQAINERSLCHACGSIPDQPHVTSCLHLYCKGCLDSMEWNSADQGKNHTTCLDCGTEFTGSEPCRGFDDAGLGSESSTPVARSPTMKKLTRLGDEGGDNFDWYSGPTLASAKINAARQQIADWLKQDETSKVLIFVQFRGLIKIISRICHEESWGCAQYHGGMSFDARANAIKDFTVNPKTKIMAASMKAGGVGLNLTAANRVIIIDLWWNESVETQAFCRVFRIGQGREVEIVRFVVQDTVDMDILQMQERKTLEINQVMSERHRPSKFTIQELMRLFGDETIGAAAAAEGEGEGEPAVPDRDEDEDKNFEPFIMVEDDDHIDSDSDADMPDTVPGRPF